MDLNKISNLTAEEVLAVIKLKELAEEAKKMSLQIYKNYKCFGINENRIEVWCDANNAEYLTHDGKWQARYLHQEYDVMCTADGIFEVLKADYFVQNGFVDASDTEMQKKAEACRYFRAFVNRMPRENEKFDMQAFRNVD